MPKGHQNTSTMDTEGSLYGGSPIGPSQTFRRLPTRGDNSGVTGRRHGLRPSVSLPAIPSAQHTRAAPAEEEWRKPRQPPFHKLPPMHDTHGGRPPSSCFHNDIDSSFLSPARLAYMRRRAPVPLELGPIADPRQDPLLLYILRKHRR